MLLEKEFNVWYAPGMEGSGSLQLMETFQDMITVGWVKVQSYTVTLELDMESHLATSGLIHKLEKAKSNLRAEVGAKCTAIDAHIAAMLQLDYTPAADEAAPRLKDVETSGDEDDIPF